MIRVTKFRLAYIASAYTEARSVDIPKKLEPSSKLSRRGGAMRKEPSERTLQNIATLFSLPALM